MSADIWIRARSGPSLGIGHRVRAIILAEAISEMGRRAGLILDADAPDAPDSLPVYRLPPGKTPPGEAEHYPLGDTPVILDLSHPSMLADLPDLVVQLRSQGRRIGLIDGLAREAYTPEDAAARVDVVLTPYVLEADAPARSTSCWLCGPEYAVLDPVYAQPRGPSSLNGAGDLLVFISGTDPWFLTEALAVALKQGGLPEWSRASLVAGPGFDRDRRIALAASLRGDDRFTIFHSPPTLRSLLDDARLALLGPGLAKYEAAARGVFSLIASPDEVYAAMNRPFEEIGLAIVLPPGVPDPDILCQALEKAGRIRLIDPRSVIDGAGARRAAKRFVSELFTESGDG